jgi:dihydrofolate synthase / folylpolyglutamate synthase
MNYDTSVGYLLSLGRELAAPTQAAAAKFDLENISVLDEALGHPSRAYPSAHIAGTNGKGSTAAFLESILRHAGFRTGLNTSPHLEKINERIRINSQEISDEVFAATFSRMLRTIEQLLAAAKLRAHPTYFECVTAMAFEYFAQQRVDFSIFEVGLGGRLDATNILKPAICVITRIDFDHENFLGHSLHEIAAEKAGILKPGVPVVMASQHPEAREVIVNRAAALGCAVVDVANDYLIEEQTTDPTTFSSNPSDPGSIPLRARIVERSSGWSVNITPSLPGHFQLQNALNAIAGARSLNRPEFPIPDEAIVAGIANTIWPGRLEKLQSQPDLYLDGAHNPAAARELAAFLTQNFAHRKIWMIYGALRDKAVDEVAGLLFPLAANVVITEPRTPRFISAAQLAEMAGHHAKQLSVISEAEQALDHVLSAANSDDAIFITGSLYLVGQLRHYWSRHHWKSRPQVAARQETP